jgi:hypothetical protein
MVDAPKTKTRSRQCSPRESSRDQGTLSMSKRRPPVGSPEVFSHFCNRSDGIPEAINESTQEWENTPQSQPT